MAELLSSPEETHELRIRQDEFAAVIGVDAELLRGLRFCDTCDGDDYQWTDWTQSLIEPESLDIEPGDDVIEYRHYLAETDCDACDGSGFNGGNFGFTREEWLQLGGGITSADASRSGRSAG